MIEHNWQDIIGASRRFLDSLRLNAASVQRFDASQSQTEAIYAANVGRAIGHPASNARVRLSRDPRCNWMMRDDADVAGMFNALYANQPNVRLAALRLWRFYCRESIMRLLSPFKDSAERQDAIADLVNMGSADFAELDTAINQLALATGNLSLAQVQIAASPQVESASRGFEVKVGRIADELSRLADLLDMITNGEADDIRDGDGWRTRTDAGLLVARLQALLNYGDLDFADCDFPTLERLKSLWSAIKRLDFGDHSYRPKEYRGALFLPHELCPVEIAPGVVIHNQKLRGPDEPYEAMNIAPEERLAAADAAKVVRRERGTSPRLRRVAIGALSKLQNGPTTTKRERWGRFPGELREYAAKLARNITVAAPAILPQADDLSNKISVPKRPQASENNIFPNGNLADDLAQRCIERLHARRDGSTPDREILLELLGGDARRVEKMQVEIRRLRSEGETTLPVNPIRAKRAKRP